jgi:hypothetical protein
MAGGWPVHERQIARPRRPTWPIMERDGIDGQPEAPSADYVLMVSVYVDYNFRA